VPSFLRAAFFPGKRREERPERRRIRTGTPQEARKSAASEPIATDWLKHVADKTHKLLKK
jgi:hypothetical protein